LQVKLDQAGEIGCTHEQRRLFSGCILLSLTMM
jgi:hypothetical protein